MAKTYTWTAADHSAVTDGEGCTIPADPDNSEFAQLLASGMIIAEPATPLPPLAPAPQEA
jgi:hypothetical protein